MIKMLAIGNIGRDAEVKDVNGKKVMEFSIAHTEKFMSNNVPQEKTTWVNCSYWNDKTTIAQYLKKGTQVYVEGTPSTNAYTNKEGKVVSDLRLRIISVQLLGSKANASNADSTSATPIPNPPEVNQNYDDVKDDLPF